MAEGGIVTILFTDVVNSTELLTQLGDERAEASRRDHFRILRETVAEHGGREVKTMGDGIMVVFASAVDAVRCATGIQRATATKGIELRVGLHVGEPIQDEDDYFGTPVVVARRLCDAAAGGQILTSDLVHALVGTRGEFMFHDAGFLALKGLGEPVAAWEVAWESPTRGGLPLPAALTTGERLPFVGRDDLLQELRLQWKKAKDGHRALVMLAGEPGIGKTRLAGEFAREVHTEGAQVLFGHADEETLLPYQPFVEAFHHIVRHASADELRALVGENGGELGRLLPALHERMPDIPEPVRSEPESERFRLFEAAAQFTAAITEAGPLVLVLDDMHWADKPSLLLLHHLFRTPNDIGLLVVGTYRDTDLDRRHPLAETLADLRRLVQFERLGVSGMDESDLNEFIDLVTGQEPPADFARAVLDQTEGNPFFIGEVLRHLIESGAISVVDGEWVPTVTLEQLGIPEGVKEVIGRRVNRLSEEANVALAAAAVTGRDFDLDVLERVTEMDEDRLLTAIDEAVGARLVIELPGPVARFHFAHALVRETLYDELTTARRVRMHRRIAQVLEDLHQHDAEPPLAQLAYHWFESASAADVAKAVDYARRAASRALELFAYEEAAGQFERALQGLELEDSPDEGLRCDLLTAKAAACQRAGDGSWDRTLRSAVDLARKLGDGERLGCAALGFAVGVVSGTTDAAYVALLEEALDKVGTDDSEVRARLLDELVFQIYYDDNSDPVRAHAAAKEALAIARRLGDPHLEGAVFRSLVLTDDAPEQTLSRLAAADEGLRIASTTNDASLTLEAHVWRVMALLELGRRDDAMKAKAAVAEVTRTHRLRNREGYGEIWGAADALANGDVDTAEQLANEAFLALQANNNPGAPTVLGVQTFALRREQSRIEEIEPLVGTFVASQPGVPAWRGALALCVAELDRPDEAQTHLAAIAPAGMPEFRRDTLWLVGMALFTEASYLAADASCAEQCYDALAPFEDSFVAIAAGVDSLGSVQRYLGLCAALAERWDDAERHLLASIAANRAQGDVRNRARDQLYYAELLLTTGRTDDAHRVRDEALAAVEGTGLVALISRLRALS